MVLTPPSCSVGHLHKPVTKDNWFTETRTDLFSHHTMKHESFVVDAFREGAGPGVLGRMLDMLEQKQGAAVAATSIGARAAILDGNPAYGRLADVMSNEGAPRLFERTSLAPTEVKWAPDIKGIPMLVEVVRQDLRKYLQAMHSETGETSGVFGDAFSQSLVDMWNSKFWWQQPISQCSLTLSEPVSFVSSLIHRN